MKNFILSCLFITAFSRGIGHPLDDAGIEKTFWLNDFLLESGVTLPKAYIKYVTYGSLNKNKSNAILLPSWYGADYKGYNFLLGKGKSLDTTKYFVILSELFFQWAFVFSQQHTTPFSWAAFSFHLHTRQRQSDF